MATAAAGGVVMSLRNYLVTQGHTWILNESVSLQSHAIAVARAVGLPFDLKRLKVGGPLRYLPASLQVYLSPARFLASVASSEPFDLSWPRLIIAIGRRSVPVALSLKSKSQLPCFALHIRNRKWLEGQFDLFVSPMKRGLKGANVMATFDAVYSVSTMIHTVRQETDPSISNVDVVAKVIKGALGLGCPPRA